MLGIVAYWFTSAAGRICRCAADPPVYEIRDVSEGEDRQFAPSGVPHDPIVRAREACDIGSPAHTIRAKRRMSTASGYGIVAGPMTPAADLYWIPLGAGGHCVRRCGRVFEPLVAARERRPRCDLYHAALVVTLDGERHTIELAPSPDADLASRGVVATGPVGSRRLARLRLFRYEVRCWRGGVIPDLAFAVDGPRRVTTDPEVVRRTLALVVAVPTPVWGLEWNSNSVIAWLLAAAGLPTDALGPPPGGRAPGWSEGLAAAQISTKPCSSA